MDLKKVSQFDSLVTPESKVKTNPSLGNGPSFAETLKNIPGVKTPDAVKQNLAASMDGVKFSNHAVERMQSRGISFNKADMDRLTDAVGRAAAKGSKDTLVLMNDAALIVSVKNKTVVTVMDQAALKENVFTNIDSTIVM